MMTNRDKYNQLLERIDGIFNELRAIVESIKLDFDEEKRQDPRLTIEIVDFHLAIIKKYCGPPQGRLESTWSLERDLHYTIQTISGFHREFDNPFLGSQRWYQRMNQLQDQLSEQYRDLHNLIIVEKGE